MEDRGALFSVVSSKTTGFSTLVLVAVLAQHFVLSSDKLTPTGVPLSRAALYDPQKDFSCLDGSKLIPFSFVNDDYCDCADGSDEPGTSACSRGSFYCQNAGHISTFIPSSRVNDGICDCCDGSDETSPGSHCTNTCDELGRAAREAAEAHARLLKEGFSKRQGMSEEGSRTRKEREQEKARLEAERRRLEALKEEKAKVKEELEIPEKEALERIRIAEEEATRKREEEESAKEHSEAESTFALLDSNGDGKIDIAEIQSRQTFDKNKDGVVDSEEAHFFLNLEEELEKEEWIKSAWPVAKPFFLMEQGMFKPPPTSEDTEEVEHEEPLPLGGGQEANVNPEEPIKEYGDDEVEELLQKESKQKEDLPGVVPEEEEEEQMEDDEEEEDPHSTQQVPPVPEPSKYDEETQRLVDQADKARSEFNEAERNVNDVVRQLEELNDILNVDFGEDERWAVLHGQCYDFEDREYVYTLCPFKSASQKGRNGGGEVSLGKWGSWVGPESESDPSSKYSTMLYDRGQSCWNGPNRSARVNIVCGVENRLVGVSEPSRCEYQYEFTSPAACPKPDSSGATAPTQHQHTEL